MTLSPDEQVELDRLVEEQAEDVEWLDRVDRHFPVASSVLWTAPSSPCDQRRAIIAAMQAPTIGIILGGERSGKSRGCKDWVFCNALGGDHPVTRSWLDLNGLPRSIIPDGPAEMYAVALRSGDSVRYHRPDFAEMAGRLPHSWSNMNGKGEATLRLHVPGYPRSGKIHFMSIESGADSMQGISLRGAWVDEEPLGEKGRKVVKHLRGRVADQDGRIIVSMVPTEGLTWFHDDYIRDGLDDAVVLELDTLDNPHLPRERFLRHFAGMDANELAQRRYGRFRSRSGAVYSLWTDGDGDRDGPGHIVDDFEIPAEWTRFRAGDFGLVNPTCVGWGALGDDDCLYVYGEYYQPNGESYPWHAERVAALERGETVVVTDKDGKETTVCLGGPQVIEAGFGDPAALKARQAFAAAGVGMVAANNDVKGGIDQVKDRLRLQGDGKPRLKVFRSCRHHIREIRGLTWDPNRKDEVPIKRDDHAADELRYMVMGVRSWQELLY